MKHRSSALQCTNFEAVYAPFPGNLTVTQNLRIFGMLYKVGNLRANRTLLEQYELARFRNTKCGVLSSGEQTSVSLAKAMLNAPAPLLDEPTASLDPVDRPGDPCRSPRFFRYRFCGGAMDIP